MVICLHSAPRHAGLTLVELLVALTIAVIVTTIAVPSFRWMILDTRLSTSVNDLVHDLALARSNAVIRGRPVVLCPSTDGAHCLAAPEWHRGWIVFVDSNRDRNRGPGEPRLRVHGPLAHGISAISSRARRRIVYHPLGFSYGSNLTVTFCASRHPGAARALILSNAGRPRIARTGPGRRALRCPP